LSGAGRQGTGGDPTISPVNCEKAKEIRVVEPDAASREDGARRGIAKLVEKDRRGSPRVRASATAPTRRSDVVALRALPTARTSR
jgi:hypothetical protein